MPNADDCCSCLLCKCTYSFLFPATLEKAIKIVVADMSTTISLLVELQKKD